MGKDHIALPKSTLRRFVEEGKQHFYYIDVFKNDGKILTARPKSYYGSASNDNTEGYYPEAFDKNFVQKYETDLGKIAKWAKNICNSVSAGTSSPCDLTANDRSWLRQFCLEFITLQTERRFGDSVVKENVESGCIENIIEQFMSLYKEGKVGIEVAERAQKMQSLSKNEKQLRDFLFENVTKKRFYESVKNLDTKIQKHHGGLDASIVHIPPSVKTTFLLTPFHLIQTGKSFFVPMSPRLAIALLPPKYFDEYNTECQITEINDEDFIKNLIKPSIKMARESVLPHLIGEQYTLKHALMLL